MLGYLKNIALLFERTKKFFVIIPFYSFTHALAVVPQFSLPVVSDFAYGFLKFYQ